MTMQTLWPWAATIGGWVLAAAGVALVLWAVFWDRSRGRRRCPRCWYDMTGVPGLRCPECGREARREGWLHKTRRRWRAALVVVLIVWPMWHLATSARRISRVGWVGAAPDWVLLTGTRWLDVESSKRQRPTSISDKLAAELGRRLTEAEFSGVEQWMVFRGAADRARRGISRGSPEYVSSDKWFMWARVWGTASIGLMRPIWDAQADAIEVRTRSEWPAGSPIGLWIGKEPIFDPGYELEYRSVRPGSADEFAWRSFGRKRTRRAMITGAAGGDASVEMVVRLVRQGTPFRPAKSGEEVWRRSIRVPVRVVPSADDAIVSVEDDGVIEALRSSLAVLFGRDGAVMLGVSIQQLPSLRPSDLCVGAKYELIRGDVVVARTTRHLSWMEDEAMSAVRVGWIAVKFDWMSSHITPDQLRIGHWRLRACSDAATALLEPDCERCWRGDVTFDLDPTGRVVGAFEPARPSEGTGAP